VLFESSVICEYLEDTLPHPLHPADPLIRAQHRGWMEFGSAILGDIWGYETARDEAAALCKAAALKLKFERVERALGDGPFFAGAQFSVVDAVFAPIFRYFDVFDGLTGHGIFVGTPEVRAWRAALAARPSVRNAVDPDYPKRLRDFLGKKGAWIGHSIATNDGIQPKKSYMPASAQR
jgi:glutathione S-transferase